MTNIAKRKIEDTIRVVDSTRVARLHRFSPVSVSASQRSEQSIGQDLTPIYDTIHTLSVTFTVKQAGPPGRAIQNAQKEIMQELYGDILADIYRIAACCATEHGESSDTYKALRQLIADYSNC